MNKSIICALFLICAAVTPNAIAATSQCTQAQAIAAENESSSAESWLSLYKSFNSFEHCDDGAIAEGYSEAVARLFTLEWRSFHVMRNYVRKNKRFERFLLRHIDGSWSIKQVEIVTEHAKQRCLYKDRQFCAQILHELGGLINILEFVR